MSKKAKLACSDSWHNGEYHFRDVTEMIKVGGCVTSAIVFFVKEMSSDLMND